MADSDPRSKVFDLVEEHDVRFIRLWFTDILGSLKSFSINASELDRALEGGIPFDGASLTGFNAVEESDMVARPDPATFSLIPWRPGGEDAVARMFCDIELPGGAQGRLTGLFTINEERLTALPGVALEALAREGHLLPMFMQIASLAQLTGLVERSHRT